MDGETATPADRASRMSQQRSLGWAAHRFAGPLGQNQEAGQRQASARPAPPANGAIAKAGSQTAVSA